MQILAAAGTGVFAGAIGFLAMAAIYSPAPSIARQQASLTQAGLAQAGPTLAGMTQAEMTQASLPQTSNAAVTPAGRQDARPDPAFSQHRYRYASTPRYRRRYYKRQPYYPDRRRYHRGYRARQWDDRPDRQPRWRRSDPQQYRGYNPRRFRSYRPWHYKRYARYDRYRDRYRDGRYNRWRDEYSDNYLRDRRRYNWGRSDRGNAHRNRGAGDDKANNGNDNPEIAKADTNERQPQYQSRSKRTPPPAKPVPPAASDRR